MAVTSRSPLAHWTVVVPVLAALAAVASWGRKPPLARDTVFAAVMITCNGILGLSLLVGAVRRRVVAFNAEGTGGAFATVAAIATLSMVLPTFTTSRPGPQFSPPQLAFAAVASLALYLLFVAVQTWRHRDYFLPVAPDGAVLGDDAHAVPHRPAPL